MKHQVLLNSDQRKMVQNLLRNAEHSARVLRRCKIVLLASQGQTDTQIAEEVDCSVNCVANLRKRFAIQGIERALFDAPRPGAPNKFTEKQLQKISDLAEGEPPQGHQRWTIELICEEAKRRGIVESISVGRVYQLLRNSK